MRKTAMGTFLGIVDAAPNGLRAAVSVTITGRSVRYTTPDSHAASAIEMLALRHGVRSLRTLTDDGTHVVGLKGFAK